MLPRCSKCARPQEPLMLLLQQQLLMQMEPPTPLIR